MAKRQIGHRYDIELRPLLAKNGPRDKLRFMILGGDDALMDKACGTILGERGNRDAFRFGNLEPRKAQVCERQVSVLKTPSYWLEHLKSKTFFRSRDKVMQSELQFFESLLFPGPNAFLLVLSDVKNSGRENYLLPVLSEVFGKEVLDYCMVLFINEVRLNDAQNNSCLKMCGGRYHRLQNTDESVIQLLKKTEAMTQWKSSIFFTNHLECFGKAEKYFEAENEIEQNNLRRELEEHKESAEKNLQKEMNNVKERNAKEVTELNERIKDELKKLAECTDRENKLSNELDALKRKENKTKEDFQKLKEQLSIYKNRENELSNELDALKISENQTKEDFQKLKEQLIVYKNRERHLKDDKEKLQREVEQLKNNDKQLQNNLTEAKVKEAFLLSKLQSECNMIQREEQVQVKEKELHERNRELNRRVKELDDRKSKLDERQKQLEIREREVRQRDV